MATKARYSKNSGGKKRKEKKRKQWQQQVSIWKASQDDIQSGTILLLNRLLTYWTEINKKIQTSRKEKIHFWLCKNYLFWNINLVNYKIETSISHFLTTSCNISIFKLYQWDTIVCYPQYHLLHVNINYSYDNKFDNRCIKYYTSTPVLK